jgi:hypothetical protein
MVNVEQLRATLAKVYGSGEVNRWLRTPNVLLDGESPEQVILAGGLDRVQIIAERLEELQDCACLAGDTRTVTMLTIEDAAECKVCESRLRHDLVDHPFYGFVPNGPCPMARRMVAK